MPDKKGSEYDFFYTRGRELKNRMDSLIYGISKDTADDKERLILELQNELNVYIEEFSTANEEIRSQNDMLREVQAELELEQQLSQDLFDFSPDGLLVTDLNGKIIEANMAAAAFLNIAQPTMIHKVLVSFIALPDRKKFRSMIEQLKLRVEQTRLQNAELVSNNPTYSGIEIQMQPRGREPFTASLSAVPVVAPYRISIHWSIRDITARIKAEQGRLELLRRLVATQEEISRSISRELHDQTGQFITALILGLKALENKVKVEADSGLINKNDAKIKTFENWNALGVDEQIIELLKLAEEIGREVHNSAWDLRPTALDDLGLAPVLSNYAEEWSERHQIPVDFQTIIPEDDGNLSPEIRITVFRVAQEALTNIAKHSGAQHASLILERMPHTLRLIIEDDGSGFDVEDVLSETHFKHLGLLGMHERAELINGELSIESEIGKGTTVFLRIPLSIQEDNL